MKIRAIRVFLLCSVLAIASACSTLPGGKNAEPEIERNVYTNLPGSNGEVIAVKVDDTNAAHPQQSIEFADVVFITQVEAGLTRLMGIYSSNYPEVIGPVRSARISDIDILAQFGRVGFLYSGAQSKLRPVIAQSNLVNLSAERNPPTIYFNDSSRVAPYAMMVKPNLLLEKSDPLEIAKSIGWSHGERSDSAKKIESVKINWPNAQYEAYWSKAEKRFLLKHNGKENISSAGVVLGSNMMVIQKIEITPSEYGDKFGGITPKNHVVGQGEAFLLRDGRVTKALWSRESATAQTNWTLQDGTEAKFADGQVWFFLTDQEPEFTYPARKSPTQASNP
ncbi:MAG: DUF3048 domain-containing protein [Candidatus Nanopelagicaceae bacterium]|nr:DUF3048 domain-containing protein [Candidatus Nanopelagicaceae bacterium]